MGKQKKKLTKADWIVRIVVAICAVMFIVAAVFVVPRINSKQAQGDTYIFQNHEYPAFHRAVPKRGFSIDMFHSDKYRQYLYVGKFTDQDLKMYVEYLEKNAGYTLFPQPESRWHYEISAGQWDQNHNPRYINIVHYDADGAIFVTLW